jgi:hypothetical protein
MYSQIHLGFQLRGRVHYVLPLYALRAATPETASWPLQEWLPTGQVASGHLITPFATLCHMHPICYPMPYVAHAPYPIPTGPAARQEKQLCFDEADLCRAAGGSRD